LLQLAEQQHLLQLQLRRMKGNEAVRLGTQSVLARLHFNTTTIHYTVENSTIHWIALLIW